MASVAGRRQCITAQCNSRQAMAVGAGGVVRSCQRETDRGMIKTGRIEPILEIAVASDTSGNRVIGGIMLKWSRPRG